MMLDSLPGSMPSFFSPSSAGASCWAGRIFFHHTRDTLEERSSIHPIHLIDVLWTALNGFLVFGTPVVDKVGRKGHQFLIQGTSVSMLISDRYGSLRPTRDIA